MTAVKNSDNFGCFIPIAGSIDIKGWFSHAFKEKTRLAPPSIADTYSSIYFRVKALKEFREM